MNLSEAQEAGTASVGPGSGNERKGGSSPRISPRVIGALICLAVLLLGFGRVLYGWAIYVAGSEVQSYELLVPFIAIYLLWLRRPELPKVYSSALIPGGFAGLTGAGLMVTGAIAGARLGGAEALSMAMLALILLVIADGCLFLGLHWMRAAAFPAAFLLLAVPLWPGAVNTLETFSKYASAEAAALIFHLARTPLLREGLIFVLPGATIQVAQECSGIRSSLVLLVTGLLVAHMFLRTLWRRVLIVLLVVPLGFLRNGFRIFVIGQLCSRIGPEMALHPIHTQGGPVFFLLSLGPLAAVLWMLRRGERPPLRPH